MPYLGVTPAAEFTSKDLNGEQLILDADADTTITADTDDQIDIRIAGADDFKITANTLTALSGSTIATNTIAETTGASGVTIDGLLIKDSTAAFADGAVGTPSITNTGDLNTGVYFPAADTVGVVTGGTEQFRFGSNPIPGGSKNMLINGNMAVAQRGSLAAQGGTNVYTSLDRWELNDPAGGEARWDFAQGTSGGVSGKDTWLSATVETAESAVGASEINAIRQKVEGNNARGLINSSGQIKASTLSFDVKFDAHGSSSTSAPYAACVFIYAVDANYTFTEEFSIASDNTWERIEISVPALAQAASTVDTTEGYRIAFVLYSGATYHATSGSWESGNNAMATSNQENLADYAGNIFGITNVQWEVGSVATDFAHEDIGTTLLKSKRYYERLHFTVDSDETAMHGGMHTTTSFRAVWHYAEKRAAPTLDVGTATDFKVVAATTELAVSGMTFPDAGPYSCGLFATTASTTLAYPGYLRRGGTAADAWIEASAEL